MLILNTAGKQSISGSLVITRNDEEQEEVPFHFTFDSEDLSLLNRQMDILSEAEADGISLKLLNVEPGLKTGWDLVFLAGNHSGETCSFGDVYLNNIHIGAWFSGELPNETEKVYIVHEDNAMSDGYLLTAGRFEYVKEPLYYYYQHDTSTIHSFSERRCEDRMEAGRIILDEAKRLGFFDEFKEEIEFKFTQLFYVNNNYCRKKT